MLHYVRNDAGSGGMILALKSLGAVIGILLLAIFHIFASWFVLAYAVIYFGPEWGWPAAGLLLISFIVSTTLLINWIADL
ncbi:hypothetical protein [Erythrobacter sp.]|uniref:hypothetical protein n=1 Tax=Erythrobacter sp. TaxID=1042 RepID=UPI003C77D347